ncbi:unnamed protein product [Prunus brigantina]
MAFSNQLLKVPFSSVAVVGVMTVLPVECAAFTGVPLRGVFLHGWWSPHPRLVLHLS